MNPPVSKPPKLRPGEKEATISLFWGCAEKIPHGFKLKLIVTNNS